MNKINKPAAKSSSSAQSRPAAKAAVKPAPKAAPVAVKAGAKDKISDKDKEKIAKLVKVAAKIAAPAVGKDGKPLDPTAPGDKPLLDSTNQNIKKLIQKAKERGYITYDELNAALPPEEMSSEQIEDVMSMLSEMGINVVEVEEQEEAETPEAAEEEAAKPEGYTGGNIDEDDVGRTDDPVRMYLREMGSVELLSREGEIAIAKRIEAGREMMIGGICESPITIRCLLQWHDALQNGKMLLRDIIDLDATYGAGAMSKASDQELEVDVVSEPVDANEDD
ncbi:MAG: hypothetical protein EXR11_13355, partial [Rhodospirillaceae bacterium]|nr:hypothetical protein [Rhodospirillaceae bacterium]